MASPRTPEGLAGSSSTSRELMRHLTTMKRYVEETPTLLKIMCFTGGVAIVVNGILGVLDVFGVFDNMVHYVVNAYLVFFGFVTCLTELDEEWAGPQVHGWLHQRQKWMHEWALGLTMLWGRGLFYIFQGTLCVVSSSLFSLGLIIGVYMMVTGFLCLNQHFRDRHKHGEPGRGLLPGGGSPSDFNLRSRASPNDDYIRVNY
uniref:Uncharacterized protein n=1 Tax=Alexandrium andersonii TaxID=327968 RepID=A0A7S2DLG9_9DINO|mmetsp:Transcript_55671/g.125648  ORF Transcript_55671/g.125648 Transcript_55671/m.125648 type:complete len:202 (+) Transcript_55671:82-687(+)